MYFITIIAVTLFLAFPWCVQAGESYKPKEVYQYTVKKTIKIEMRDGVQLAADLHYPSKDGKVPAEGRFPALLQRTPYYRANEGNVRDATYFAKHGYVAVVEDVRGRFGSQGPGLYANWYDGDGHEGPDGYDTVEWIARQPWSNGKVGTWGFSTPGAHAYACLAARPPHLAAFLACAASCNYWKCGLRNHGAFEMRYFHGAYGIGAMGEPNPKAKTILGLAIRRFDRELDAWPIVKGKNPLAEFNKLSGSPSRADFSLEDWYFNVISDSDWPGKNNFWIHPGQAHELYYWNMPDIPMLHYTCWYDSYNGIQDRNFTALSKLKKGKQYLVMSPRTHTTNYQLTVSGDIELGPALAEDYRAWILAWYDQWFRGIDTGVKGKPPVKLWIMGTGTGRKTPKGHLDVGGHWRYEHEWPLARTQYTKYYFQGDGALSPEPPRGNVSSTTYQYDPDYPVPSIGGCISAFGMWLVPGGYNQVVTEKIPRYVKGPRALGPLSKRADVIVFQTPPLQKDVEITGPVKVRIFVSSDCVDTDFTAKLIYVFPPNEDYPEGYALNLGDGIIRARYHGNPDNNFAIRHKEKLIEPGKIYEMEIELGGTAIIVKKGHRIRIDISSSNYPRFDCNPNTGEPLGLHKKTKLATNIIYHDRNHRSYVLLPIIPD